MVNRYTKGVSVKLLSDGFDTHNSVGEIELTNALHGNCIRVHRLWY